MEYDDLILSAARKVPAEFRDDAYQAGCIGLINGLKNIDGIKNPRGYLYRCVANEMMKECGKLHRPFALKQSTFALLLKYKKMKGMGTEQLMNITPSTKKDLDRILSTRQRSFDE